MKQTRFVRRTRIRLIRRLHEGIRRSTREGVDGVVATFPATKRGVLKAARAWAEQRKSDEIAYGDIGAGRLWLELGGRDITEDARQAAVLHDVGETGLRDRCIAEILEIRPSAAA